MKGVVEAGAKSQEGASVRGIWRGLLRVKRARGDVEGAKWVLCRWGGVQRSKDICNMMLKFQ